jgi:hypothetical protein
MRARGAIASDNIPVGTAKRSSAPNDIAPNECCVHLRAPIREIGEIQPDENSARSARDSHESVSQQRNRQPAPRVGERGNACTSIGPLFLHNRHVGGSTVSGEETSYLTENLESGSLV